MDKITRERLISEAKQASLRAYCPYSGYPVGSAVITGSGNIYSGANVENSAYGSTMCAERVAVYKAVTEGEKDLLAIAVYSPKSKPYPCGSCRQVLAEFNGEMPILVATEGEVEEFALSELLPKSFKL